MLRTIHSGAALVGTSSPLPDGGNLRVEAAIVLRCGRACAGPERELIDLARAVGGLDFIMR